MNSLILKNCTIADANHPEPREGKHILIENEWIKEIEDQSIQSESADSIDLRGKKGMLCAWPAFSPFIELKAFRVTFKFFVQMLSSIWNGTLNFSL